MFNKLLLAFLLGLSSLAAQAEDLAISAADAYTKTQQTDNPVLLVDVRDPVEIMFVGATDSADINIPFMLVDRHEWNDEKGVFKLKPNADFVQQVQAELEKRGLPANTEIITMCRSGSERGKPSADILQAAGLNASYIEHGFQGDAIKDGKRAGFRTLNGWQNAGLPWGTMNANKIYKPKVE